MAEAEESSSQTPAALIIPIAVAFRPPVTYLSTLLLQREQRRKERKYEKEKILQKQ
jgi:hypothetical protein